MKYVLGLDIGIASVGWAVLNLDDKRIEHLGVRAFPASEEGKNQPRALARRQASSSRGRLRRRVGRLRRAKDLFVDFRLISEAQRESVFQTGPEKKPSPWQLRTEGLDRMLTGEEFARSLFHIVKRRGPHLREMKGEDKEGKKVRLAAKMNERLLGEGPYRTAGEMLYACSCPGDSRPKRTRNSPGWYENSFDREMFENEVQTLFQSQRALGSRYAGEDLEGHILEVFNWQKPFASGDDILNRYVRCTFEPNQLRSPKHCYTAELCNLLQKVNALKYMVNGVENRLDDQQRARVVEMAHESCEVNYSKIRTEFSLAREARFVGLRYARKKRGTDEWKESRDCEDSTFFTLRGYHTLREACSRAGVWDQVKDNRDLMDILAYALSIYKNQEDIRSFLGNEIGLDERTDPDIRRHVADPGVPHEIIEPMVGCEGLTQTSHLSLAAHRKMLPYLQQGLVYSDACGEAGYDHSRPSQTDQRAAKLPTITPEVTTNPVVLRALSQARKVVNALVARYGAPHKIHIELAREMGKGPKAREDDWEQQLKNKSQRQRDQEHFREQFKDYKGEVRGEDLLKFRLYREQGCKCAYSQQSFDLSRLLDRGYAEIDHVLPWSRSWDGSLSNRVLVLAGENRMKGNKTPWEAFGSDGERWDQFEAWCRATIKIPAKWNRLLRKNFDKRQETEFVQRNLNDTRYITAEFARFVRNHLKFAESQTGKPIVCLNGHIVGKVRGLWHLGKDRKDDLNHALDAAVIASLGEREVQEITRYAQTRETGVDLETGEIIERPQLPYPWPGFRGELEARLSHDPETDLPRILVSRMPQRKMSGPIHKDTVRSLKRPQDEAAGTARKGDGAVSNAHNGAFEVRGGVADNAKMIRTDVFRKAGKHYLVPVYVKHWMEGNLPNRAIAAHKPESDWPLMDDSYEFVCSLYPYDLVRIKTGKEEFFGYYRGTHRGAGAFTISMPNNNREEKDGIGARTAPLIQRFEMGVLGDYHPVRKKEVRRGLENHRNLQSGATET